MPDRALTVPAIGATGGIGRHAVPLSGEPERVRADLEVARRTRRTDLKQETA